MLPFSHGHTLIHPFHRYHKLTLTLLKASWKRTQKMIAERRTAIVKIAEAMMAAPDERISGEPWDGLSGERGPPVVRDQGCSALVWGKCALSGTDISSC